MPIVIKVGNREWRGIRSVSVDDLEVHSYLRLVMKNGGEGSISQDAAGAFIIDVGTGVVEHVHGTLLITTED